METLEERTWVKEHATSVDRVDTWHGSAPRIKEKERGKLKGGKWSKAYGLDWDETDHGEWDPNWVDESGNEPDNKTPDEIPN